MPKSEPFDESVEIKRTDEIKKAYRKLYKLDACKVREMTYWRIASFENIFLASMKHCTQNMNKTPLVGHLFSFDEDQKSDTKVLSYVFR